MVMGGICGFDAQDSRQYRPTLIVKDIHANLHCIGKVCMLTWIVVDKFT